MERYRDISEAITGYSLDDVVVIDTETTGLDIFNDEILSIGICDGHGHRLLDTLVRPTKKKRWDEAQEINGISPQMVVDKPTAKELREQIKSLLYSNKLVVGYNHNTFDLWFIKRQCEFDDFPAQSFDIMKEYARVHGERWPEGKRKYTKLEDCAKSYGYSYNAHRSIDDAIATAYCYRALLADEDYLHEILPGIINTLQIVKLEQRKAITQNVLALVNSGKNEADGILKVGVITAGKNKGKPRYEAYVDSKCVGVSNCDEVAKVEKLFYRGGGTSLPDNIHCHLTMTASHDKASSQARISSNGAFGETILAQAANERKERQQPPVIDGEPERDIAQDSHVNEAKHAAKKSHPVLKAIGTIVLVALGVAAVVLLVYLVENLLSIIFAIIVLAILGVSLKRK